MLKPYHALIMSFALSAWACTKPPTTPQQAQSVPASAAPAAAKAPQPPQDHAQAPEAAQAAPTAPQGDCLSDTQAHALNEAKASQPEDAESIDKSRLSSTTIEDLDQDGKPEQLWIDEYSGTANMLHMLYLSNKGCTRYGGQLWVSAESIASMEEVHEGMRKLTTFAKDGCAGLEGAVQVMAWSKDHYKVERTIRCACPDDNPKAARDPACP